MQQEVADFLHYCRIERRLADLTCAAYERDVKACVRFLNEHGIDDLRLVRAPDLRRFLAAEAERRPALGSQARTVARSKASSASASRTRRSTATRRSCCAHRRSARRCRTYSTAASSADCSRRPSATTSGSAT